MRYPTSISWSSYNLFLSGVILIVFLVHSSYINNGFTWLDHRDIEQRRAITPLSSIDKAFVSRFGDTGFYRPLVTVVHSLDYWLYGHWAPGFHLTNIILHLITTGIVPLFLRCYFFLKPYESLTASLIFGLHPITWLPTGAISYRPELLLTLFTMLAVIFHTKSRMYHKSIDILLAITFFIFGIFSKETALFWIPSLILLWEFIEYRTQIPVDKLNQNSFRLPHLKNSGYILFLIEFSVMAFYIILRLKAVPEIWKTNTAIMPFSQLVGTRLAVIGYQILSLINPFKPNISDATFIVGLEDFSTIFVFLIILFFLFLIFILGIRNYISRTLLIIAICLAPTLNILPLPRFRSPHYSYFAVVGAIMTIILLMRFFDIKYILRNITKTLLAIWILIMAYSTFAAGFQFKNDRTLFEKEVNIDQNFLEGHYYLGNFYLSTGNYSLASREYELAMPSRHNVIAFVDKPSLLTNLALIRIKENHPEEAEILLTHAEESAANAEKSLIAYNRAVLASQQGNYTKVFEILSKYKSDFTKAEPLLLMATALKYLHRTQEAKQVLKDTLIYLDEAQKLKIIKLIESIE